MRLLFGPIAFRVDAATDRLRELMSQRASGYHAHPPSHDMLVFYGVSFGIGLLAAIVYAMYIVRLQRRRKKTHARQSTARPRAKIRRKRRCQGRRSF